MKITRTKTIGEIKISKSFEISIEEYNLLNADLSKILGDVFQDFEETSEKITVGERGPEAIIPLNRDPNITILNKSRCIPIVTQNKDDYGNLDIEILIKQIEDKLSDDISSGGTKINRAIEGRYKINSSAGNYR